MVSIDKTDCVEAYYLCGHYSSGKTHGFLYPRAIFNDAKYWQELEDKYLNAYTLPTWDKQCSSDDMSFWIERVGFAVNKYLSLTNLDSLDQFCERNPS